MSLKWSSGPAQRAGDGPAGRLTRVDPARVDVTRVDAGPVEPPAGECVVRAEGLGRRYGQVDALVAVDVAVPAGTVLGVLGHDGAGKTTLVDLLSTRLRPTSGTATVCGIDVVADPAAVRARVGVVTHDGALDGLLGGRANLVLLARLLGLRPAAALARADELLDAVGLTAAAALPVRGWSAGMRRRLDLAASLLGAPDVVFLDEPTTGLDPECRTALWHVLDELVAAGTSVVLTTRSLHEAEHLADDLVVLERGSVVATGSPAELTSALARRTATVTLAHAHQRLVAADALTHAGLTPHGDGATLAVPIDATGDITVLVCTLDATGVAMADLAVGEPTLDDVVRSFTASEARA